LVSLVFNNFGNLFHDQKWTAIASLSLISARFLNGGILVIQRQRRGEYMREEDRSSVCYGRRLRQIVTGVSSIGLEIDQESVF